MRFAFDLDGTISKSPSVYTELMNALIQCGHHVTILTAAAGELPPIDRPAEVKRRLDNLKIPYTDIVCTETATKAADCLKLGCSFLVDDSEEVINTLSGANLVRLHAR